MDIENLINNQRSYFKKGHTKSIRFRLDQLEKLKDALKQNEALMFESIYADFKKSAFETFTTELGLLYNDINVAIKNTSKWANKKKVKSNLFNLPSRNYIIPEPLGVCLVIGAWNYPFQLSFAPVISAIAAGNTVILKPSEIANHSSNAIAKIVNENFPPEFFHVIEGGIKETGELLQQKFDKIFFTGSTTVGRIVYEAAAKHLTPVTLELGGKSPAIVTKDCNLKITCKRIAWAKFLNAGQTCIAPDYVLVDENIKDEFLKTLKECIVSANYSFQNENYVQIINERNFNRLTELIDASKVYYGGKTEITERYIEPTVLTNITFDDKIMKDEIFGPILPVLSYRSLDTAIQQIVDKPKPLACYVFTNNNKIKNKILSEISFGGGAVNDALMHVSNDNLPFGGVGESGTGSYHGEAGFITFSHYKSILEKPLWLEPQLKYPPYSNWKLKFIKWMCR